MKTALITGACGQGGHFLAALLERQGYRVVGTTRQQGISRAEVPCVSELVTLDLGSFEAVVDLVDRLRPDEIYHLAAPSSVARSFDDPVRVIPAIAAPNLHLLESVRRVDRSIRFLEAGSIEMYGERSGPINEDSLLDPRSPYGVGKATSFLQTRNYREAFGLFSCTAVFSNFESHLRRANFVTAKIINGACRIAAGEAESLQLGNIEISRDWGWAPEYMEAANKMLALGQPSDIVVATGRRRTLREFLDLAFKAVGLDYRDHVHTDPQLLRPLDNLGSYGDPTRALELLDWSAQSDLEEIISRWIARVRGGPVPLQAAAEDPSSDG